MTHEATLTDFSPVYLVPSLQAIAAARICIDLYIRDDLLEFLVQLEGISIDSSWPEQNIKVKQLANSINLPPRLKSIVLNFSNSVDDELYNWIKTNDWIKYRPDYGKLSSGTYRLALFDYFHNCLVWTSRGTVHYEKTARNILRSEFVTKEEQLHLACDYCFQDVLSHHFISTLSNYEPSFDMRTLKPWVYYWICRFFPQRISELTNEEGLLARQNTDKRMLIIAKNGVALRHIFDRLDLMAKEETIERIINCCDFEMKNYFISQLSFGTRENVLGFNSDILVLNELTNILWQDYVVYHFNTYGPLMTGEQVVKILHELLPLDRQSTDINDRDLRLLNINELWSCLSENVREELIIEFLKRTAGDNSPLPQILAVLLNSKNYDLIKKFLRIVENETVKLEVENMDSSFSGSFSIDSESYKGMQYYPKPLQVPPQGIVVINKRLHLIHQLITATFLNHTDSRTLEPIQNDIIDVFVEYCRFGQVKHISTILDNFFNEESDKISYKSSIFNGMFNKLLKKAVDESYYGLGSTSYTRNFAGGRTTSYVFGSPQRIQITADNLTKGDPFVPDNYSYYTRLNAYLDRRVRSSRRQQSSNCETFIRKDYFRSQRTRELGHRRYVMTDHIPPLFRRSTPQQSFKSRPLVIYNSDRNDIVFSAVDSFLNWYFSSPEQVKEFKTNMILNERVPMVVTLLKENKTLKLQQLLRWFLCDDEEKFNAFKNTCPRNELTSLL